MSLTRFISVAIFLVVVGPCLIAAPLTVTDYSAVNGGAGTYNYMDYNYSSCPGNGCKAAYTPLSGGTGKLTDGVLPTLNWNQYGGPGAKTQWVGWSSLIAAAKDPIVTFDFASTVYVDSVTVLFDNTPGFGGVVLPAQVWIAETAGTPVWQKFTVAPDPNSGPVSITFSGFNLSGSSIEVQFWQVPRDYVMVGEVSFAAPEPATWLLIGGGLAVAGLLRRKRVN